MLRAENNEIALVACVTVFSGFLQTQASPGSGFLELYRDCHLAAVKILGSYYGYFQTQVYPFDANVSDVAESLWRYRPYCDGSQLVDCDQVHLIAGYSYGGQAACNLATELAHRGGVVIRELALCDPVKRTGWYWPLSAVPAALGIGSLEVDPIVGKVWSYRQRNPRYSIRHRPGGRFQPCGHDVIAVDPKRTVVETPVVVRAGHCYIDNDRSFRQRFVNSTKALAEEVKHRVGAK